MPWALRHGDRVHLIAPVFVHAPPGQPDAVELLDINRQHEIGPASMESLALTPENLCEIPPAILALLKTKGKHRPTAATLLSALAHELASSETGQWSAFNDALNNNRYEVSAWFERDRKHLGLTDLLDGREIVSLWDEDVDDAIDSGYLRPPRGPRPNDSDWLAPLLEYTRASGLLVDPGEYLRQVQATATPTPRSRTREAARA